MSIMNKMNSQDRDFEPGSKYKDFLHEVIKTEMELQMGRKISNEDDFKHACLDYLGIVPEFRPIPEELEYHRFACYSCKRTADKPQTVVVGNAIVSLHMECISDYIVNYLTKNPFNTDFVTIKLTC